MGIRYSLLLENRVFHLLCQLSRIRYMLDQKDNHKNGQKVFVLAALNSCLSEQMNIWRR